MARLPRFDLPGIPRHVVQRGNNRLPCFLDDGDRQHYPQCLLTGLRRCRCALRTSVLVDNHVHLLVTPRESGALPRLMHTFSRNYACRFNDRHGRTGTLWEGRYKACVVDSTRYFLACCRDIELDPVRAWMVAHPGDCAWSSWRAHVGEHADTMLTPHAVYLASGADGASRAKACRTLLDEALTAELVDEIRRYLVQSARWVPTGFAPGCKRDQADVPRFDRPGDRREPQIVRDTISAVPGSLESVVVAGILRRVRSLIVVHWC